MSAKPRHTRTEDAYARLKRAIRANELSAGEIAPEPEIALRLGMSRTPVREALIRLESEGLVELVPRRGARVLPIKAEDMREIYELLAALEPEAAAALASRRPSADELAPLEESVRDMEAALSRDDLEAWAEADSRFHQILLVLGGNRRMRDFVNTLYDQVHRARMFTLHLRAKPVQSTQEHRQAMTLIARGEAEAVRRLFRLHRRRASAELLKILETCHLHQL